MVNENGILYTIEGVVAGILMITTTYLVLSTTMVFTPGDTHIIDMQLEQLGNDALAVMDTPLRDQIPSPLEVYVETNNATDFTGDFLNLTQSNSGVWRDVIKFNATVYYREKISSQILAHPFANSSHTMTGREHMVKDETYFYQTTFEFITSP